MNKIKLAAILSTTVILAGCFSGCMTSKVQTVTATPTGFATNTTTVVNEANLAIDTAVLQSLTSIAVTEVLRRDHSLSTIKIILSTETALNGVLSGANDSNTGQLLTILGSNGSDALSTEIKPLIIMASSIEQNLLAKYGATVAGKISNAIAKSVYAGMATSLPPGTTPEDAARILAP
jgi:hypothetical protein